MMRSLNILLVLFCWERTGAQIFPSRYFFHKTSAVNGSSPDGHCSDITTGLALGADQNISSCNEPFNSVLQDEKIPVLCGSTWANQLLTLQNSPANISFDFTATQNYVGVRTIKLVMFNCPDWKAGTQSIILSVASSLSGVISKLDTHTTQNTSCASLQTVCIQTLISQPVVILQFAPFPGNSWVHLAEVTFYGARHSCREPIIASEVNTTIPSTCSDIDFDTTSGFESSTTQSPLHTVDSTTDGTTLKASMQPSFATDQEVEINVILVSVLTSTISSLLTVVIFIALMIAICKYRHRTTPGEIETHPPTGAETDHTYESIEHNTNSTGNRTFAATNPVYACPFGEVSNEGSPYWIQNNQAYAVQNRN